MWQLLLTIVLIAIGIYLVIRFSDQNIPRQWLQYISSPLYEKQVRLYHYLKTFGWVLIIAGVTFGAWSWWNGTLGGSEPLARVRGRRPLPPPPTTLGTTNGSSRGARASMPTGAPNGCKACDNYAANVQGLRPYPATPDGYRRLQADAAGCAQCDEYCRDRTALGIPDTSDRYCQKTAGRLDHARESLRGLGGKLKGSQTQAWATSVRAGGDPKFDPFPRVPTGKVGK